MSKQKPKPSPDAMAYTWQGGSEMSDLSVSTLRRRAQEGLLRTVRVGSRTLITGDSLRRLLGAATEDRPT